MSRVVRQVHDKLVLGLIRRYLQAGVLEHGLVQATVEGTRKGVRYHHCYPTSC